MADLSVGDVLALNKAFQAADNAWSAELGRLFGKRAGDVRYTPRGHGEPGTELRRLSEEFDRTGKAWRAVVFK